MAAFAIPDIASEPFGAFILKSEKPASVTNNNPTPEIIVYINQRDIFQHVPITSRKPVMPDSKGVPGFFAFWGSSRILMNPGVS